MIFLFDKFLMSLLILMLFLGVFVGVGHLYFYFRSWLLLMELLFVLIFGNIGGIRFAEIKLLLRLNITFKCFHITIILLKSWSDFALHFSLHSSVHDILIGNQDKNNNDKDNAQNNEPFAWMQLTIKNFTALIRSIVLHFANCHSCFYGIKFCEFLFIDKQNRILCDFLSDIILALFPQPYIVINLLSGTHKRLIHFLFDIIIIYFSQHHWVSCTYW